MLIRITLQGKTPLLMHNPRMVDPDYEITRAIKPITAKRKKTDEDLRQIAKLEWYGGLYHEGDVVVQPTSKVRKCLIETAKISKQGKTVGRALNMTSLTAPLVHDGPKTIDAMFKDIRFHSRLSVGVGGKRVMRVRPQFLPWALEVEANFLPDAGMQWSELVDLVKLAGEVEGLGDGRAIGYGRFEGSVKELAS